MKRIINNIILVLVGIGALSMIVWNVWFNWYEVKATADYPLWSWLAYGALMLAGLYLIYTEYND